MADTADHAKYRCSYRLVECSCGVVVKERLLGRHQTESCNLETLLCTLGCGAKVIRKNMSRHTERHCPKRTIVCPNQCVMAIVTIAAAVVAIVTIVAAAAVTQVRRHAVGGAG